MTIRHSGRAALSVPVALTLLILSLGGCASGQARSAGPAGGADATDAPDATGAAERLAPARPSAEQARQMLAQAREAHQEGRHAAAVELLDVLRANLELLTDDEAAEVATLRARAQNVLHQQRLAAAAGPEPRPAPPEGPEEVEPTALAPEAAALKASEMLAEAERLWNDKQYGKAAAQVDTLDPFRPHLSDPDKLLYDELRRLVQLATRQVRPLSEPDKAARAQEHLAIGLRAYEDGDYAAASSHLRMATLLKARLGKRAAKKLSRTSRKVDERLRRARQRVALAAGYLEAGDLRKGRRELQAVRDEGIRMGPLSDEVDRLLTRATAQEADLERVAAAQTKARAARLLEQARALTESGNFEEAARPLGELKPLTDRIEAGAVAQYESLRDAVESATGIRPGLSAQERRALANKELELGLLRHEQDRYTDALPHLRRASRLADEFGWWSRRKLRNVQAEVEQTLEDLTARYERGRRLYADGNLKAAREALAEVQRNSVRIGQPGDDDVRALIAKIDEQQRRELEARKAKAAALLREAREFAEAREFDRADERLAQLDALSDALTREQRRSKAETRDSIRKARAKAELERRLRATEETVIRATNLMALQSAVRANLAESDRAAEQQDYETAAAVLAEAQALLAGADAERQPGLSAMAQQVRRKAEAVQSARERQVRRQAAVGRLAQLAGRAAELADTDVLAAEKQVNEMAALAAEEDVPLSADQAKLRDDVLAAVQKAYRVDRWLRPAEYGRLIDLAERYALLGEHAKAAQMLSLVETAPARAVSDDYRARAQEKLKAARWEADGQKALADGLLRGALAESRRNLEAGALEASFTGAVGALETARQQRLAGPGLIHLLEAATGFLEADFADAVAQTQPELKQRVSSGLAASRIAVARQLAPLYVDDRPELAESHLKALARAEAAEAPSREWARGRLTVLDRIKADAEQRRLESISGEAQKVGVLAGRLLELAQAGKVEEAEAADKELADLRIGLQVKKARVARSRGAYDEAVSLLRKAPADRATEQVVADLYEPALAEAVRLRDAARRLDDVEAALETFDVGRAATLLAELQAMGPLPEDFELRKQALASVAESALLVREGQLSLQARAAEELARARARLAQAQRREEAWQGYYDEISAFLTGRQSAAAPLRVLLANPAGLKEFEQAEVTNIVGVLVEAEREQRVQEARQLLMRALGAYNAEDYVGAAAALDELEAHPGYSVGEKLGRDAALIRAALQDKEREAEALYRDALEAHKAGNAEGVRKALGELKADYAKTKAFRDHM